MKWTQNAGDVASERERERREREEGGVVGFLGFGGYIYIERERERRGFTVRVDLTKEVARSAVALKNAPFGRTVHEIAAFSDWRNRLF